MLKQLLYLACLLYLLASCIDKTETKQITNSKPIDFKQTLALKQSRTFKISLDSLTPQLYGDVQIYEDTISNKKYLHFFNTPNYQIYFYDLATQELAFTIKLEKEGENGVGKDMRGYQIKNLDSIFVYNYPVELSIVNRNAKKSKVYRVLGSLERDTLLIIPNLNVSSSSPIIFKDNSLIMSGYTGAELEEENAYNRPFVIYYDLQTQELTYGATYTKAYQNANWGGSELRHTYAAYNPDKDLIVYSLPIEHSIYTSKDGKNLTKHYAGSKYFDKIPSLDKPKKSYHTMDMDEIYAVYAERPSYSYIIYDKYRKLYYRIAELPIDKFDPNGGIKTTVKETSIIILDENFNYLGETRMKSMYSPRSFFITEEGLGFVKYIKNGGEDEAFFDLFKIVKKNEK